MAKNRERQEQEAKEREEQRRVEAERAQGAKDLAQHNADEAAKNEEQRAADEAEAQRQQEEVLAAERDRAEAEQSKAAEVVTEDMPAEVWPLAKGTKLQLNGEDVELFSDAVVLVPGAYSERQLAAVLARDLKNFGLNSDRLRLVYDPMNGTVLPLGDQRLSLDEMTEAEAAIFAPPAQRPSKK